jgi:hypothetical protein
MKTEFAEENVEFFLRCRSYRTCFEDLSVFLAMDDSTEEVQEDEFYHDLAMVSSYGLSVSRA